MMPKGDTFAAIHVFASAMRPGHAAAASPSVSVAPSVSAALHMRRRWRERSALTTAGPASGEAARVTLGPPPGDPRRTRRPGRGRATSTMPCDPRPPPPASRMPACADPRSGGDDCTRRTSLARSAPPPDARASAVRVRTHSPGGAYRSPANDTVDGPGEVSDRLACPRARRRHPPSARTVRQGRRSAEEVEGTAARDARRRHDQHGGVTTGR